MTSIKSPCCKKAMKFIKTYHYLDHNQEDLIYEAVCSACEGQYSVYGVTKKEAKENWINSQNGQEDGQ